MGLKVGETGKRVYVITGFDMSSNTSLTIYAVPPSGETNQKTWTASLDTSGFASVALEGGGTSGTVAANTAMYYDLAASTDLDESGTWTLIGVYENTSASPDDKFISTKATISVADDGFAA